MYFTFKIDLLNKEKLNLGHSTPSKAKNSPFCGSIFKAIQFSDF